MNTLQFLEKYDIPNVQIAYFNHPTTKRKTPLNERSTRTLVDIQYEMKKQPWTVTCQKYNPVTKKQFVNAEIEDYKTNHGLTYARSLKPIHANMCCIDVDMPEITKPSEMATFMKTKFTDNHDKIDLLFNDNMAWTSGNSKGIHIYVKFDNFNETHEGINVIKGAKVDLIFKQRNMWEKIDKNFYGELQTLDFKNFSWMFGNSNLQSTREKRKDIQNEDDTNDSVDTVKTNSPFKSSKYNLQFEQRPLFTQIVIEEALDANLFLNYANDYDNWIELGFAMVNENQSGAMWLRVCRQVPDGNNLNTSSELLEKYESLKTFNKKKILGCDYIITELKKHNKLHFSNEYVNGVFKNAEKKYEKELYDQWYKTQKDIYEKDHFLYRAQICKINKSGDENLIRYSKDEAKFMALEIFYDKEIKLNKEYCHKYFFDHWSHDNTKRRYEYIDCVFTDCPPDTYNLYNGFDFHKFIDIEKNILKEQYNSIRENNPLVIHHEKVICNSDEYTSYYLANYLYDLYMNPSKKMCVAFIVYSQSTGTGKSLYFIRLPRKMLGTKYVYSTGNIDIVFGHFNGVIEGKLVTTIEENSLEKSMNLTESIKNEITADVSSIHKKQSNPHTMTNNNHFFFLTNNKNSMYVQANDRRMVPLPVLEDITEIQKYCKGLENMSVEDFKRNYFRRLESAMENDEMLNEYFQYMKFIYYPEFNYINRPKCDLFVDNTIVNASIMDKWLLYICEHQNAEIDFLKSEYYSVTGSDRFIKENGFVKEIGVNYYNCPILFKFFTKVCGMMNVDCAKTGYFKFQTGLKDYFGNGIHMKQEKRVNVYRIEYDLLRAYCIKKKYLTE